MMLHRTLDAIIPAYREIFREFDLSETQWRVLRVLWEFRRCKASELSEKTLIPPPSMVGLIDRMIKKGLVERDGDPSDRRVSTIQLTEYGRSLELKITPRVDALHKQIKRSCDSESWHSMMNGMSQIIGKF